jgi:hypothetical protein
MAARRTTAPKSGALPEFALVARPKGGKVQIERVRVTRRKPSRPSSTQASPLDDPDLGPRLEAAFRQAVAAAQQIHPQPSAVAGQRVAGRQKRTG